MRDVGRARCPVPSAGPLERNRVTVLASRRETARSLIGSKSFPSLLLILLRRADRHGLWWFMVQVDAPLTRMRAHNPDEPRKWGCCAVRSLFTPFAQRRAARACQCPEHLLSNRLGFSSCPVRFDEREQALFDVIRLLKIQGIATFTFDVARAPDWSDQTLCLSDLPGRCQSSRIAETLPQILSRAEWRSAYCASSSS